VLLITPWDTLPDLAQSLYWFLPARGFIRDRYDNVGNLRQWAGPLAVVAAEQDEIIPSRNARRLFDSLACPKRLWVLPGVGHNNWPAAVGERWWGDVMGFLSAPSAALSLPRLPTAATA